MFCLDIQLVTQKEQVAEEGHGGESREDVLNVLRSQLEGQSLIIAVLSFTP